MTALAVRCSSVSFFLESAGCPLAPWRRQAGGDAVGAADHHRHPIRGPQAELPRLEARQVDVRQVLLTHHVGHGVRDLGLAVVLAASGVVEGVQHPVDTHPVAVMVIQAGVAIRLGFVDQIIIFEHPLPADPRGHGGQARQADQDEGPVPRHQLQVRDLRYQTVMRIPTVLVSTSGLILLARSILESTNV